MLVVQNWSLTGLSLALLLFSYGCTTISPRDIALPPAPKLAIPSGILTTDESVKIFVDGQLGQESCSDYDPDTRSCGSGDNKAFRALNRASTAARPGDEVLVRQGVIRKQFKPATSGVEGRPIRYHPYTGEQVVFTGIQSPAWFLLDRHYLVIEGFHVEEVIGWGRLENAHYNEIRNNIFKQAQARGTTGGLKLTGSHYNRIENNRFERGNDSLVIQASDRNLIAGNSFEWGRHSLLSLRCGNFNVIRENTFHNERQKSMEVYDCEAVSDAPYRLDATKRNLIEHNRFIHARASGQSHRYNAIQYAGQFGIVRHNLFRDNLGGGINLAVYADEALHNYGHRIYNNTFFENRCFALIDRGRGGVKVGGHAVLNNLLYKNRDCRGGEQQVNFPWGTIDKDLNAMAKKDPGFVSVADGDFRLKPDSPWVDRGSFLTRIRTGGQGKTLPLEDVAFFFDGAGVPDVNGDLIQLEGEQQVARVLKVDFSTQSLLLDTPLVWQEGQGVSLLFGGASPDMGAYGAETQR
ncbi:MAG: right-handed parallel beta-helix repeat-containing protein [Candidatus Thiodiazotropha sp. (ex Monitilora ramsayi)]|nr:right-handed parallel beta-helix repeat-containing protein [Candidatus Thiodiazotropha sp. (ex Monitilora ramsayi)]